jgi:hypothetical protein
MILKREEAETIVENAGKDGFKVDSIPLSSRGILDYLKSNLADAKDKEEIFDVAISAINRIGCEFSFIAIFREDRKYSSAVRIRVDSELVNRVEDYAQKMMPNMTVMRYRIPIYEDGRIFRRFLLEGTKPLISDNVKVSNNSDVLTSSMSDLYDNLISSDSPLKLLLPAFKRIVPYKYAMSTHIFIDGTALGNIGAASTREFKEDDLNTLILISSLISGSLESIGFGKNYI